MFLPKLPKISFMCSFNDVVCMSRQHSSKFSTGNMRHSSGPDLCIAIASEFDPVTLAVASTMQVAMGIAFPAYSAA
jgi:hypothetical protein